MTTHAAIKQTGTSPETTHSAEAETTGTEAVARHHGLDLADVSVRVRLGTNPETSPAILNVLAGDPDVTVRASVALNSAAPSNADRRLAADGDERVRMLLARKVLALLPGLSQSDQLRRSEQTVELLFTLVQDEAVRIRVMIGELLATLPGVPRHVILALAHDAAIPVGEPVLRLSPLLADSDLLALLQDPPHDAAFRAIAGRANLPGDVADMIAASADSDAIRTLLSNPSAAIREHTLDALIARAHGEPDWHGPLVSRPSLPPRAAYALSEIVTGDWLKMLAERQDLSPTLKSELKQRLWARLAGEHPVDSTIGDEAMMHAAKRLHLYGQLNEAAVHDAVSAGDVRRVSALLAVAAGVPLAVVDRAASMRSAKALVSLVWRAGFSMQLGVPVQTLLGRLSPTAVLDKPSPGFPMGIEEMGWQLDLLVRVS